MGKNFDERKVYETFAEAKKHADKMIGWIAHILRNDGGTFSVMAHANVEWCDYCDQRNVAHRAGLRYNAIYPLVHAAVEDPYANQGGG